ncbi:TerB family tellurite resistance protein [Sporolactobacillus nakayamae]|uniref:DnaJ like chaperone protein n=1 Tax=Sporolactobacillus nakayamae TaxID=269670 RepID=A0A1I2VB97_9BACL|nr:TerB family tellurite resistance protein [Sporolactobacillus nakayamae]SFG85447.1 DnaJ like chaperone protein [Sporolactobacillus nakayamae]
MTWRFLFAIAVAVLAAAKKRNVVFWFIVGFLFEWIPLIIILFLPNGSGGRVFSGGRSTGTDTRWHRKVSRNCPYCGHHVTFDDIPGNWTCPDCGNTFTYNADGRVSKSREDELMPQVELIVKLFAKLAKRDGVVSENEVRQVDQIVRQAFLPTKEQLGKIMTLFNESRYSEESFESISEKLYASVRGRRDLLVDTVTALFAIAAADGSLRVEEESMIRTACTIFGLAGDYESIKAQFFGQSSAGEPSHEVSLDASYRLLECAPSDSDQVIKKKYRELIKENHPDRLMSRGASEDSIKEANKKVAQIKRAYEQIMAAR